MSYCPEIKPFMNLEPSPSASNSHDLTMNSNSQAVQDCLKVVKTALEEVKAKEAANGDYEKVWSLQK